MKRCIDCSESMVCAEVEACHVVVKSETLAEQIDYAGPPRFIKCLHAKSFDSCLFGVAKYSCLKLCSLGVFLSGSSCLRHLLIHSVLAIGEIGQVVHYCN